MKNVGRADAALRLALGIGFLVVAALVNARPFLAIAAACLGLGLSGTGLTRFCPLYTVIGVSTDPKPHHV
ncbi:MAG TPA: DUF2892 domain-containing protein [Gemmatimonadales bacterium]|nr:DUF2892 domain-containing protein [Gemmatimonadales bacterium]